MRLVDVFLYGVYCSNRCLLNLELKADVDVVKNVFSPILCGRLRNGPQRWAVAVVRWSPLLA